MSSVRIVLTGDGSGTLFSDQFQAHYHSTHGALNESNHVFIEHGLRYLMNDCSRSQLRILEYGLGTGLNVWLSYMEARKNCRAVHYHALEMYPPDWEILSGLNYSEDPEYSSFFESIHRCDWQKIIPLENNFTLLKDQCLFEEFELCEKFDLVYFDAFAPSTQAHLWRKELFERMLKMMNPGAILCSYCAQGEFRRTLQSLGLKVEKLPGPPGKREMTRARFP